MKWHSSLAADFALAPVARRWCLGPALRPGSSVRQPKLEELLDEYLKATGLGAEPGSPLFPAALGKTGKLSRRPLMRTDAATCSSDGSNKLDLPAHIRLTLSKWSLIIDAPLAILVDFQQLILRVQKSPSSVKNA